MKLINSNPVSAADFFKKTLEAFYEHVVGQKLNRCSQRTVPLGSRKKGIFGKLTAGFHAIETQRRKHCMATFCFGVCYQQNIFNELPHLVRASRL
jgi:hypothetical protein